MWKKPIRGYEKKNEHVCHVKVEKAHFYEYLGWGACRKYSDGSGKGNNGDEYDLYKDKSYRWCKDKCSEDEKCTGFEHRYEWENEQCEIWHVEIKSVEPKEYLDCYQKVYY